MERRAGIALRPELYTPKQIMEYSEVIDRTGGVSHIFIPDIPGGLESIEISASSLAKTERVKIGSGIIRLHEHDNEILKRRLKTIQSISGNRFVLGVGTGRAMPTPSEAISKMLSQLDELRNDFSKSSSPFPETFVATLKQGIAKKAIGHSDGLLLNFCSPDYAKKLVGGCYTAKTVFACYLKVFYSKEKGAAERLLVEEFAKYDSFGHYHNMFVQDGIANDITEAKKSLSLGKITIPDSLGVISLVNPKVENLNDYVLSFRKAGIDLPVLYPYFLPSDDGEYKKSVISEIASSLQ